MKIFRIAVASLALAGLASIGCILTSAQILTHFDLPNPFTINSVSDPFERVLVDLNTIDDYNDNKDKLEGLSDLAILGRFTNVSGPAGGVEVWVTADNTNYLTIGEVTANGTKLWGPGEIGAAGGPDAVRVLSWDESAALFTQAGKAIVISETKGDGVFTIYTFGTTGLYDILVEEGVLVLTLDAGQ